MSSWIEGADSDLDFTIHNIPFGLVSTRSNPSTRPATRLGNTVVDIQELVRGGVLSALPVSTLEALATTSLRALASLPAAERRSLRAELQALFSAKQRPSNFPGNALVPAVEVTMHLPMPIGDYTDFCISVEHMKNAGRAVTGDARIPAQMPFMPIGYHGRSSSVVVSGTPFKRPVGQFKPTPTDEEPVLAPSRKLDYEVEMAFFVSRTTKLGERISIAEAEDAIFGVVIMNDWSARDVQGFEMNPLGPFQGKNFATTISSWIVTLDALKPFEADLPTRLAKEFAYLHHPSNKAHDISVSVEIATKDSESFTIADEINTTDFYWSLPQLLVHQAISGCPVAVGDLIATGTCSGVTERSLGSLVEISQGGRKSWKLPSGKERTFLEDGDTVTMRARCDNGAGVRLGFGDCSGLILPADSL